MGTTAHEYRCQTCHNTKKACLGHDGHIELNYPVWNPNGVKEATKWIKLICFTCGKIVLPKSDYEEIPRGKRLEEASKIARTSARDCTHCGVQHPLVKKDTVEPLKFIAEYYNGKTIDRKETLYPHIIKAILSRISPETISLMGKPITSPPSNFVMRSIPVPSVVIRPDVKKMGGGRSANDDFTMALQIMIAKSAHMPNIIPAVIDLKLEKAIYEINNAYYDFVKASGDNAMNSVSKRIKGKQGRLRKNLMGKRCRNMARSTIVNDISLMIDQVRVPLSFARTIQYEEIVQEYNRHILMEYIQNGSAKYPGASRIVKKNTKKSYNAEVFRDTALVLENGDTVYRDMVEDDPVPFNRQPSLKISNISTHRAVVCKNPNDKAIGVNVIDCALYNADFDGDQMNFVLSTGLETRNEVMSLSSVANWMISHTSASPPLGQVDDSIIGMAELTRSDIRYDKYHAMMLFQNTTLMPSFTSVTTMTGREALSITLADTPINFTRVPEWYKQNMAPYLNYDPSEIRVVIDQGVIKSGILDKKSIGKNSNGGIYHIIANEFGAERALVVMYNMQQLAIAHVAQCGYTIGINDLMVDKETKIAIDSIASDIINKSKLITEDLYNGEIIPPIGKTVTEFYEERQINTLSIFDDFTEPILKSVNARTNNLFKLIAFGSKGKMNDMFNMMSAIGQKLINGERIRLTFGYKRSLVYFRRFDTSPESRGYITNSYLGGMRTTEYIFNAMAARFDLITKALSTSITGEQMRKSIKNLESIITNNFRWSVKNQNIIQFAYGNDFLDPRHVEKVKFPTVTLSDEAFSLKYSHDAHPEFFATMLADRDRYRRIYLKIERASIRDLMGDVRNMPVNIERVIGNITREYASMLEVPSDETLAEMVESITSLCDGIAYVLINEIQEKRKSKIPNYIKSASWLLCMLIRSYLHPKALVALKLTPDVLKIIIDRIRLKYSQALVEPGTAIGIIAAQSFSEPLTQYMLDAHHRSASGGTSKSGIISVKEILGAKAVDQLRAPSMLIPILPEYASDRAKVQEIANNIEVMRLTRFVSVWQVFFEKFGEPIHSATRHEAAAIAEFVRINPLLTPPGDLVRWCIRFVLNKTTLILKNMSIELIVVKLREAFPELYIVYSPENAVNTQEIVLRIYMRNSMFKAAITTADVVAIKSACMDLIIRGVDRILTANVTKLVRSKVNADGSIGLDDNVYGIVTLGTNMYGVLANRYVDKYYVQTDAIQEMYAMLGISAARRSIASGLANLAISDINQRHYVMYADEMTYTGKVTSIESSGIRTRENSNVLLRAGASSPMATLEEAALNSMVDQVTGITAPLLVGSVPNIGTIYNGFYVNKEFVKANVTNPDDLLAELL